MSLPVGLPYLERATVLTAPEVDGRTIVGLCVPYNKPTNVSDDGGKTRYYEEFVKGAFRRAVQAPNRVAQVVNIRLSHSADPIVQAGRALSFREEDHGLIGEFLTEGPAGETLVAMARSGEPIGLSIGAVGLSYRKRKDRGLSIISRTSCHLDHVAATKSAAYNDAKVLAVRAEDVDPYRLSALMLRFPHLLPAGLTNGGE